MLSGSNIILKKITDITIVKKKRCFTHFSTFYSKKNNKTKQNFLVTRLLAVTRSNLRPKINNIMIKNK